jgi:hypothetical protein
MAKHDDDQDEAIGRGILGDITPNPEARDHMSGESGAGVEQDDVQSMHGGSQHDRTKHSGSRDVTEGPTGGTGTEVGGTRNYRQGTGATGTDIGGRPE